MIQKKICLIGSFSVGKTSLVRRYVESIFDEKYQTTIGVKIDKKTLNVESKEVTLVIWDIAGEDDICQLKTSYLRGASGIIVVADGTREKTIETAKEVFRKARETIGDVPSVIVLNKSDLTDEWALKKHHYAELEKLGLDILRTSAKTGEGVDTMFERFARTILNTPSV